MPSPMDDYTLMNRRFRIIKSRFGSLCPSRIGGRDGRTRGRRKGVTVFCTVACAPAYIVLFISLPATKTVLFSLGGWAYLLGGEVWGHTTYTDFAAPGRRRGGHCHPCVLTTYEEAQKRADILALGCHETGVLVFAPLPPLLPTLIMDGEHYYCDSYIGERQAVYA